MPLFFCLHFLIPDMKHLIPDYKELANLKERTCRTCQQTFPLTTDFYYTRLNKEGVIGFLTECKECRKERNIYNYHKKKVKVEEAEKNQWMEELKDKIFGCKICGLDKKFDEMKKAGKQKLQNVCKVCANRLKKEVYTPNYKANIFEKVLKERRELNEGEK